MKIIDAHLHFAAGKGFDRIAVEARHKNTAAHLEKAFAENDIVLGIAMGTHSRRGPEPSPGVVNLSGEFDYETYNQSGSIAFCAGVGPEKLTRGNRKAVLSEYEKLLKMPQCVGLKLYPGYDEFYPDDPEKHPYYELAEKYDVPVVFHSGDTASAAAHVKFAHPLAVDDVATRFRRVRFVIAHYGNPWIADATEVAMKNPNVHIDLSGLAEGFFTAEEFIRKKGAYLAMARMWMDYLDDYSKFMFGTDWPLVNLRSYIGVIRSLVPEEHHGKVFFENALRVFPRAGELLRTRADSGHRNGTSRKKRNAP